MTAALRFRIQILSQTGKNATIVTIQMNASSIRSETKGDGFHPNIVPSRRGQMTASDAIQSGKLIQ